MLLANRFEEAENLFANNISTELLNTPSGTYNKVIKTMNFNRLNSQHLPKINIECRLVDQRKKILGSDDICLNPVPNTP